MAFSSWIFGANVPLQNKRALMKIIFSDIDGVLNCSRTPNPRRFPYIAEPQLVARLNTVLERTGAKIVLTSTWRYDPAGLFSAKHWGIPFIDITPDLPKVPRRDEILAWLRDHPGVTRFAVLDDEDDELDGLPLFQPSAVTGLTEEMAGGLEHYLAGTTDQDMRSSRLSRIFQNLHAVLTGHKG
jgi:HAD domain in Swiss Army Knife RNA repair proteins